MKPSQIVFSAALMFSVSLSGCERRHPSASTGSAGELTPVAAPGGVLMAGDTLIDLTTLPVEMRAALAAAEAKTALALWRAGHTAEAAIHFDMALGKTPEALSDGLTGLGFDAALLGALSDAAAAGETPASKDADIAAFETRLDEMLASAGGDFADTIDFLVKTCVVEYRAAVSISGIEDFAGYARAWGRARIVHDLIAARLSGPDASNAQALLQAQLFVRLWPREGPGPGDVPPPFSLVDAQAARVNLEASSLLQ